MPTPEHHEGELSPARSRVIAGAVAVLAFLVIAMLGDLTVRTYLRDQDTKRRLDLIAQASILRAKVESELNSILYLSSGLGSYVLVRNNAIERKEINDILGVLYRNSRYIRNFGISVGYRLTYIFPLVGNEQAIGLYYPDHKDQWPAIEKLITNGKPALAGPIDLVQGGRAIIFRVPLFIGGSYWGLLSTVIDADRIFNSIDQSGNIHHHQFSLRGKDATGRTGDAVWGDIALFSDPDAVIQDIEVPGGSWAIAVKAPISDRSDDVSTLVHFASLALGTLVAWLLYVLIRNRTELARRALYDNLTGLPNRMLLEDRAEMAFARQHRTPDVACALIFFDLDGFKDINDTYGHKAGDAVLKEVARRAKSSVRANDTVARWGGDEFIVLLENSSDVALNDMMTRLRSNLEAPMFFEDCQVTVGVSMGLAIHPTTGGDLDETLRIADQRMYDDKLARRNSPPTT